MGQILQSPSANSSSFPNIYYIILDGYPRADVLREIHHYDNSGFLSGLRQKGFYIAESSRSNYPGTALSLASSLNFDYLHDLARSMGPDSSNRWPLSERIKNNEVCRFLKKQGYQIFAFDSGYFPTELRNADHFLASGWFLNEFHDALLDTTPGWVLLKNLGRYSMQRKRILYILDHLNSIENTPEPVFVFVHIMALHPPFVFGPNGEEVQPAKKSPLGFWKEFSKAEKEAYLQGYRNQLTFLNKKISRSIETMLAQSRRPLVILLQGDHGSAFLEKEETPEGRFFKERFSILNAYYLPAKSGVYPEITPVNTFRIVLNYYFGAGLPLLKDESFFSERDHPYRLQNVTARINP
jgi:hypothetical protein